MREIPIDVIGSIIEFLPFKWWQNLGIACKLYHALVHDPNRLLKRLRSIGFDDPNIDQSNVIAFVENPSIFRDDSEKNVLVIHHLPQYRVDYIDWLYGGNTLLPANPRDHYLTEILYQSWRYGRRVFTTKGCNHPDALEVFCESEKELLIKFEEFAKKSDPKYTVVYADENYAHEFVLGRFHIHFPDRPLPLSSTHSVDIRSLSRKVVALQHITRLDKLSSHFGITLFCTKHGTNILDVIVFIYAKLISLIKIARDGIEIPRAVFKE